MKTKQYTVGTETNQVNYGFRPEYRKWAFNFGTNEFITACPGGAETAHKVANVVKGSLVRTKGAKVDGLAKANISQLVNS